MPSKMIGLPSLSFQSWGCGSRPASLAMVGHQSMWDHMSILTVPGLTWPGYQAIARHAEAALEGGPLHAAEGGVARIRPSVDPGAVLGGPHHERVLVDAELADRLHHLARIVVEL